MSFSGRSILKVGIALVMAFIGGALMITVDGDGTVWLKFVLYSIFFAAIFLAALLSPLWGGCWPFFRKQTKG